MQRLSSCMYDDAVFFQERIRQSSAVPKEPKLAQNTENITLANISTEASVAVYCIIEDIFRNILHDHERADVF